MSPTTFTDAVEGVQVPVDLGTHYERYQTRLLGYIISTVGDRRLAEDLTQEVFVRALAAAQEPHQPMSGAYLFKIATNLVKDHKRRERIVTWERLPEGEGWHPAPSDDDMPETAVLRTEARALVHRVLSGLTEGQRTVLALHYGRDLSHGAIAEAIGATRSAVKSTSYRAHHAFAAAWEEVA